MSVSAAGDFEGLGRTDIVRMAQRGADRAVITERIGAFPEYRPSRFVTDDLNDAKRLARDAVGIAPMGGGRSRTVRVVRSEVSGRPPDAGTPQAVPAPEAGFARRSTGVHGQLLGAPAAVKQAPSDRRSVEA